ncbi:sensor histidine kinase [Priestia megaterium]|jgi:signal transduction histidine kinase|uniref:sensor histidine kinase n=1 Tax=Priestia megaterium TaxID=1404 RepID=UPI0013E34BC7|nr:HAMP domain-containing sensor histidine kinase [Priestia megaterium]MDI3090879.1 HAMP domain-containing sensor histidine kinase [Priestia megaterium]MED3865985.1 HAMP domain-containing sensor histidine kinase [Priestia megaterium]MED4103057.1 HAMP domain-containing sensor histidine kinase [Priestia megaterium]MED4146562.1 HAMP domain-containing sensor histidine kinase [Priestia megaterium]MED4169515.1 HAMP domain-containing sensor histidine kinase [Priestia megaterium]
MKSIKRRLTFHFSFQFIAIIACVCCVLFCALMFLAYYLSKQDIKRDLPSGSLSVLTGDTTVEGGKATVSDDLAKQLKQEGLWYQVLNKQGKVIGEINSPKDLPKHYGLSELLEMDKTKKFKGYNVVTELDTFLTTPTYYILGYKSDLKDQLYALYAKYNKQSVPPKSDIPLIKKALKEKDASLQILNEKGDILASIRMSKEKTRYDPLEIISRKIEQDKYDSTATVFHDPKKKISWVFYTPNNYHSITDESIIRKAWMVSIIVAVSVLIATIAFSIWNAFRYGGPLLLFTSWLERMGSGNYSEVLTEKERKRVFRKNGKVRLQYRLYSEVITAFYEMAEQLSLAEKERKQLETTREEWMTGISHDLRTPLSTIQGYGHMLESGHYNWNEEELKEIGQTLRDKSEYMVELVEDFSLAFKLKNNVVALETKKVDVHQLLQHIVLKFVNDRTIEKVQFSYMPVHLQPFIQADPRWFERMLDNLIFNAIKHNPENTTITISTAIKSDRVLIKIQDDGIGMDEETQKNLFDRYYRGTNTTEKTEGAGLGMSIAKAICELHKGHIEVRSTLHEGTAITLHIPLSANQQPD